MVACSEATSHIDGFCGGCRFFGHRNSDADNGYDDYACWEYVEGG